MSNTRPLMPKATAVWLVDNTALTFDQIAEFCELHPLEVKGIADGDVAQGIKGTDPVSTGQLTRDEIKRGEDSADYKLKLAKSKVDIPVTSTSKKRGPRYTPVSRRQDRPNAILWLVRNHPELKDPQISRLAGTTKHTITQIRDRTHWNSTNLVPQDPVTLGLCTQIDLDAEVKKAAARVAKESPPPAAEDTAPETLLPADETTSLQDAANDLSPKNAEDVFAAGSGPTSREDRDTEEAKEAARMLEQLEKLGVDAPANAEPSEAAEPTEAAEKPATDSTPTTDVEPSEDGELKDSDAKES